MSETGSSLQPNPAPRNAGSPAALDAGLGLAGAIAGGIVGYYLFFAIARQGFYAVALPGVLIGLGCEALSGRRSVPLGVVCGLLGLAAGIYSEWQFAPFVKNASLSYFLAHLHELTGVTQFMILVGAGAACWLGCGHEGGVWPRRKT
jgi:hypothetical protein